VKNCDEKVTDKKTSECACNCKGKKNLKAAAHLLRGKDFAYRFKNGDNVYNTKRGKGCADGKVETRTGLQNAVDKNERAKTFTSGNYISCTSISV